MDKLILISIPRLQPTFSVSHRSFSEGGHCHFLHFLRHLFQMPTFAKATVGDRSTGCKQTPNGLFIFLFKSSSAALVSFLIWQME